MFNKIKKIQNVRVTSHRVNGKPVRVVTISRPAGIKDLARAAAMSSRVMSPRAPMYGHVRNNFGPLSEDIADMTDEEYYASLGKSGSDISNMSDEEYYAGLGKSGNTGIAGGGTSGKGNVWDVLGNVVTKGSGVITGLLGKSDKTAGKGAGNILAGLGETYIRDCVIRYKRGDAMSEFDRRVAMAAIEIENAAKNKGKDLAGDWIMNHLPEIGLGVLGVIVLVGFIARRG